MDVRTDPTRQLVRLRGRSYVAFVFTPVVPIVDWLSEIDATLARSPGYFVGKPIVLDLASVDLSTSAISHLLGSLDERGIRVLGIEGVDESRLSAGMPPLLTGGRACVITRNEPVKADEPRPRTQAEADVAAARPACSLRPVDRLYRGRRHGTGLGRLGCRDRRRRLDPHLRHVARPRDGRRQRQFIGTESTARKSRPNCWRSTATTRPPKKSTRALRHRPGASLAAKAKS